MDGSYEISISHTRGYVVIVLHPNCPVGVDIEQISPKVYRVKNRFVSLKEQRILSMQPTVCELNMLLIFWSAKETLFKLLNCEGVDFLKHLHIAPFTLKNEGMFYGYESFTTSYCGYLFCYEVTDDFVLTWATPLHNQ